jgi:hypothetical protein
MSLQSIAALATSPLHDGTDDRSSLEETPRSPAFCLLMQLSFRSRLVISCSLCYALRAECHLSAAALFRLKIASSGRGTLAGARWLHFNCNNKSAEESVGAKGLREDRHQDKNTEQTGCIEKTMTHKFLSPRRGASGAAASAATSRSTSRSPAPRGAGPQGATRGSEQSRSLSRGPGRSSSRRDEAAVSRAARLLGHGTARGLPPR